MDEYYESYEVSVTCSACLCELFTDEERQQHYTSEWHIYNIKRKTVDLPPIPYELFHEKFAMVQKMQAEVDAKKGKIVCPITKREFKSQAAYDHFRGTKSYAKDYERFLQKRQQEQQQQKAGTMSDAPTVVKNKHTFDWFAPKPEDDIMNENDKALLEQDRLDEEEAAAEAKAAAAEAATTTTTTTTMDADAPADKVAEEDDEELQEGQVAIPLKHSLFDHTGPFSCVRTSYLYMVKNFNFKLPYMEFLIDFEGLLEYLGAKVGIGHVCIGCNKRFPTTHGCMTHMVNENHTTFSLETLQKGNDDPEDPTGGDFVFDFYDFSHNFEDSTYSPEEIKQRQMSRLRTLLVLGKKTLAEVSIEEAQGIDVLSRVLTVPVETDIKLTGLTEDGDIKLSDGTKVMSRKKNEQPSQKVLAMYEERNRQIAEYKLANKSVMTKEKEQDLHELKHNQKYWRRELQKIGLRQNYILKEYFRKQNQQNN